MPTTDTTTDAEKTVLAGMADAFRRTKLARMLGVKPGTVTRWATGKQKPGKAALARIEKRFGLSAQTLQKKAHLMIDLSGV